MIQISHFFLKDENSIARAPFWPKPNMPKKSFTKNCLIWKFSETRSIYNCVKIFREAPKLQKSVTLRKKYPYSELFCSNFPEFRLNIERYGVSLHIQSKRGKMWTRITVNTDTFHAVQDIETWRRPGGVSGVARDWDEFLEKINGTK